MNSARTRGASADPLADLGSGLVMGANNRIRIAAV